MRGRNSKNDIEHSNKISGTGARRELSADTDVNIYAIFEREYADINAEFTM